MPNLIDQNRTFYLPTLIPSMAKRTYEALIHQGWKFFVVNQSRGRCYYSLKEITIPSWVFKHKKEKIEWYICHEIAHAIAGPAANHGPLFMEALKRICPADCIGYELGYKPKNALLAGCEILPDIFAEL